jgi:DNA-binding response OmpR family regulator
MRVLLVEDNEQLVSLLAKALAHAGLDVDSVHSVEDADLSVKTMHYAAIVLDLGLPDMDGIALLERMHRRRDETPVLILSARGALGDRLNGLSKGASDYLVKPFATDEFVARVQALLRRTPGATSHVLTMGNISLQSDNRQLHVGAKLMDLPAREAELLEILLKRAGLVVSNEVFLAQIFGAKHGKSSNAVEVYIHRLRQILADAGANVHIHTIRGAGYLMTVDKDGSQGGA